MHVHMHSPCRVRVNTIANNLHDVSIDEGSADTAVHVYVTSKEGAEEIAAVMAKWLWHDNTVALTDAADKLLAEEMERRKTEPVAIDERFMERVE